MSAKDLKFQDKDLIQNFFKDAVLWALQTDLKSFEFCHLLNLRLRLNLKRNVDADLVIKNNIVIPKQPDLFTEINLKEAPDYYYFPVYESRYEWDDTAIFLYTNKHNGQTAIIKQKKWDYFFLIKNGDYHDQLYGFEKYIAQFQEVKAYSILDVTKGTWAKELVL